MRETSHVVEGAGHLGPQRVAHVQDERAPGVVVVGEQHAACIKRATAIAVAESAKMSCGTPARPAGLTRAVNVPGSLPLDRLSVSQEAQWPGTVREKPSVELLLPSSMNASFGAGATLPG